MQYIQKQNMLLMLSETALTVHANHILYCIVYYVDNVYKIG